MADGKVSIPIIDLRKPNAEVVASVREACTNEGFFYLINHDVEEELIGRVFKESFRFFDLSEEKKLSCLANESHHGYTRMGEETLDPAKQSCGDTKEGYYIVADRDQAGLIDLKDKPFHGPNVWPDEQLLDLSGWRQIMVEYFDVMSKVGHRITSVLAQALGQRADFFERYFRDPQAALRLLHYAPTKSAPDEGVFAAGEHTDYGMVTLLKTDSVPGLQIKLKSGRWLDVEPLEGAFIVNLGDMLQRWSNDLFRSTPHRVVNKTGERRYSIPFFFEPDYDCLVECIPSCCSEDNPPRYPPIQSGQHLLNKYRQTHAEFTQ